MKKINSNSDVTLYDAAPGPAILLALGIPVAIVIVVVILIIVTILLVRKANRKNQARNAMGGQSGTIPPAADPTTSNPSENNPQP